MSVVIHKLLKVFTIWGSEIYASDTHVIADLFNLGSQNEDAEDFDTSGTDLIF